jgi:restriction system protein
MNEAKPPKMPVPEDFGLTLDEYRNLRREYSRPRNERPIPEPKLGLPFYVTAAACWACAYILDGSFGCRNSVIVSTLFGAPLIIAPIWYVASTISLAHEEFQRARQGDIYEQEPAHLHPLFQKFKLYEQAVATYRRTLLGYNRARQEHWRSLRGVKLENEVAIIYRELGYAVETTKATGDEGIDLILRRDGSTTLVQCKGRSKSIGVGAIRDLYGVLMHHRADRAILVCPIGFTEGVIAFVHGKPIDLLSAAQLVVSA